jgi:hypothetical protein
MRHILTSLIGIFVGLMMIVFGVAMIVFSGCGKQAKQAAGKPELEIEKIEIQPYITMELPGDCKIRLLLETDFHNGSATTTMDWQAIRPINVSATAVTELTVDVLSKGPNKTEKVSVELWARGNESFVDQRPKVAKTVKTDEHGVGHLKIVALPKAKTLAEQLKLE